MRAVRLSPGVVQFVTDAPEPQPPEGEVLVRVLQAGICETDLQLTREPLPLPTMKLNPAVKDLFDFRFDDFELVGYQSHPHIKAPVAV